MERMDEHSLAERVLTMEACGGRVYSRQRLGWMDDMKVILGICRWECVARLTYAGGNMWRESHMQVGMCGGTHMQVGICGGNTYIHRWES